MKSALLQKRLKFTRLLADLIVWAADNGYEIALAPDHEKHMKNSLHFIGLAKDFDLYIDGVYQTKTEAYTAIGEKWESMGGTWGGSWGDGCHYSIAHGGRK